MKHFNSITQSGGKQIMKGSNWHWFYFAAWPECPKLDESCNQSRL